MKPDQERIHTVLTDTISLLCRNGLNYEKELRVQGVIGVTIDDSEVFIVHINETFDTSNETADAALSSASVVDCERTTPPQSRLTSRLNQRCVVTDYPDLGSSLQKSNRLGRLKSRHPVKIPGYSQSPASCLPLRAGVVSPSLAGCSISENPVLPGTFPEKKHDEYGNVEKETNDDSQECNSRMWVNEEHSKSDTVRDVGGSCHDVDSESVAVKEDNEEGMSSNNYNSVTSSVEDSNDAVHSDAELDDRYPGIDERRIKVESEVNSTNADKACNEFSAFNSTSNAAYFPESRDLSFSMDVKTEGLEHHHPSANVLASDGYDAGGLPVRSRHLAHSLSPCQGGPRCSMPTAERPPSVNQDSCPLQLSVFSEHLDASFDCVQMVLMEQNEISSMATMLPESVETTISYEIFPTGSKRRKPLLVSSDGYSYGQRRLSATKDMVTWECNSRSKYGRCSATVLQEGDTFKRGPRRHTHDYDADKATKVRLAVQAKDLAVRQIHLPAMNIVEEVFSAVELDDHQFLSKKKLMKRLVNRHRSQMRPSEWKLLTSKDGKSME